MNNFGLYAVNSTETFEMPGYNRPAIPWKRTSLYYNGLKTSRTINEDNEFGIYENANKIDINGDRVCNGVSGFGPGIISKQDSLIFGDVLFSSSNCINITLENYNKLRGGQTVTGYASYSDKLIYNIVDNVTSIIGEAPLAYIDPELDDIVYNSFVGLELHNEVTDKTMKNPDAPSLIVILCDPIIKVGDSINIEYFTDTKHHDSINKHTIGETFTCLVYIGENPEPIYKKTTYAGRFKISTLPITLNKIEKTGPTYVSILVIDSSGCASIEYFYNIMVNPATPPRIYNMTEQDLVKYNLTAGSMKTAQDIDTGRHDLIAGHNNYVGFEDLFFDVKSGKIDGSSGYDGIKIYNKNSNPKNFEDKNNTTYYIDTHPDWDYENGAPPPIPQRYFLVYFKPDYDDVTGANDALGTLDSNGQFIPMSGYTLEDFAPFEIHATGAQKTIYRVPKVNDVMYDRETIYQRTNNQSYDPGYDLRTASKVKKITFTLPEIQEGLSEADAIFEWIRHDGARIYRTLDNASTGGYTVDYTGQHSKFLVLWYDPAEDEISMRNSDNRWKRCLRVRALDKVIADRNLYEMFSNRYKIDVNTGLPKNRLEGEGWYYLSYNPGNGKSALTAKHKRVSGQTVYRSFPDNFIVDYNYVTLRSTDIEDIENNSHMLCLIGCVNVHLKNLRIIGDYTHEGIKRAFLKLRMLGTGGCWEGNGCLHYTGAQFCTFDNLDISHSCGYEYQSGSLIRSISSWAIAYAKFNTVGYINDSGETISYYKDLSPENGFNITNTRKAALVCTDDYATYNYSNTIKTIRLGGTGQTPQYLYSENIKPKQFLPFEQSDYDNSKNTPCPYGIMVGKGSSSVVNVGSYHIVFVHCYGLKNGEMVLLKTIKTRPFLNIRIPKNTKEIKYTAYGYCATDTSPKSVATDGIYSSSLYNTGLFCNPVSLGCIIKNSTIHDTRTVAHNGAGINTHSDNCLFYNVAVVPGGMDVTGHFMDIEEGATRSHLRLFTNCVLHKNYMKENTGIVANYLSPKASIAAGTIYNLSLKNCVGISSYVWCGGDFVLLNSVIPALYIKRKHQTGDNLNTIIKRCKMVDYGSFSYSNEVTYGNSGSYKYNKGCEHVNKNLTLDDCAMSRLSNTNELNTRGLYRISNTVYKKYEGSTEQQYNL